MRINAITSYRNSKLYFKGNEKKSPAPKAQGDSPDKKQKIIKLTAGLGLLALTIYSILDRRKRPDVPLERWSDDFGYMEINNNIMTIMDDIF